MKFLVNKNKIQDIIENMAMISTHSVKMDFDKFDVLTLEANDSVLTIYSSNGYLFGKCEINKEIDPDLEIKESGKVNVPASVMNKIITSIGKREEVILEIGVMEQKEKKVLYIKDISTKKTRLSHVPLIKIEKGQDVGFASIKDKGFKFESETFMKGVKFVSPFICRDSYQGLDVFKMICMHIKKDSTNFVCGNGNRFAVFSINNPLEDAVNLEDDVMWTIPVDHLSLILPFIEESASTSVQYKKNTNGNLCFIKPSNSSSFLIKGIPDIDYVKYYTAVYSEKEANAIIDIPIEDFSDMVNYTGAHKDREAEKKTVFYISMNAKRTESEASWDIKNNQYKCHTVTSCSYFSDKKQEEFTSLYAWEYLREVANACSNKNIRIFAKSPEKNIVLSLCDLEKTEGNELNSIVKSDLSYTFFFMPYNPEERKEDKEDTDENID